MAGKLTELIAEESKRTDIDRGIILARLRRGPATTAQLRIVTHRFSARIWDLKHKFGIPIKTTRGNRRGQFIYTLEEA